MEHSTPQHPRVSGPTQRPGRQPRATESELETNFAVDVGWGEDWRADPQARTVFAFMREASAFLGSDHVVLDVSAGEAKYRPFFQHAHYVALDAAVGDPRWDFSALDIVADAMHLPIRAGSIDAIVNFVSLEHYREPWRFFEEVSRVLKPGGRLFLFAPFVYVEHQLPYDFFRYASNGLRSLSERVGLTVERVVPVCSIFFTVTRVLGMMQQCVDILGKDPNVTTFITKVNAELTSIARQYDAALDARPDLLDKILPFPLMYCLEAAKPGGLITTPHPDDRAMLLSELLACPFEYRPIRWDGIAETLVPENSMRRYPVVAGVPRFM